MKKLSPLRIRRKELGLTLEGLADEVGVDVTGAQLSRVERTGRTSLRVARALAEKTGLTLEQVIAGEAA